MLLRCTKAGRRAVYEASRRVWESLGTRVRKERFGDLLKAVRHDDGRLIIDLVEAGVDMEYKHGRCLPAVHLACLDGIVAALEALLDFGASVSVMAHRFLPLNLAGTHGHLETMRVILRFHPECINAADGFGNTAFLSSILNGEANSCATLLDEGCDVDVEAYDINAEYIALCRGQPTNQMLVRKAKAALTKAARKGFPS